VTGGGVTQLVERRASNLKVAKPRLTPDALASCFVFEKDT